MRAMGEGKRNNQRESARVREIGIEREFNTASVTRPFWACSKQANYELFYFWPINQIMNEQTCSHSHTQRKKERERERWRCQ